MNLIREMGFIKSYYSIKMSETFLERNKSQIFKKKLLIEII